MYLYEMIFAIFCLYFIHIDIVYECIVLSCTFELNLLLLLPELIHHRAMQQRGPPFCRESSCVKRPAELVVK